jgi:DNA-binding transcriptional MerR regulator
MRIGELAAELSVSTKTLRHYEKIGLLPPAARSDNQYRHFSGKGVRRAKLIVACRRMDLSLEAIRELVESDPSETRSLLIRILDERRKEMAIEIAIRQGKLEDMEARHLNLAMTPLDRPRDCVCAFLGEECTCPSVR